MFDTSRALADMAEQIRTSRSSEGLTLQQLASRSGVAASTIHKVEARQMVPTVSVLLKIAKGLGRRPEELIRDDFSSEPAENELQGGAAPRIEGSPNSTNGNGAAPNGHSAGAAKRDVGVWNIDVSSERGFPSLDLDPLQRAIVLVQQGQLELCTGTERLHMGAGDCVEFEGQRVATGADAPSAARVMLIVSPPGNVGTHPSLTSAARFG